MLMLGTNFEEFKTIFYNLKNEEVKKDIFFKNI